MHGRAHTWPHHWFVPGNAWIKFIHNNTICYLLCQLHLTFLDDRPTHKFWGSYIHTQPWSHHHSWRLQLLKNSVCVPAGATTSEHWTVLPTAAASTDEALCDHASCWRSRGCTGTRQNERCDNGCTRVFVLIFWLIEFNNILSTEYLQTVRNSQHRIGPVANPEQKLLEVQYILII